MKKRKQIRIFVGASAGGHMNQLLKLLNATAIWPSVYITTVEALEEKLARRGRVYIIGECNRYHPINALQVLIRGLRLIIAERPDMIITTGSLPLAIVCFLAKLFGAKVIWIDSIANVEHLSMSGRFVLVISDLFLTQWPELAQKYKNVEYVGTII